MQQDGIHIRVRGQVQGVGFRPFIWQLARRMGVLGEVLNDPDGVLLRCVGPLPDGFLDAISAEAPPLAQVDAVDVSAGMVGHFDGFEIAASEGAGAETRVTPDAATCPDCLSELRASADRRFGYPFLNCTHCGPRFTIVTGLPYDRARTTMAGFALCPDCEAEYQDPGDRRFHAQPVACPACGPKIWLEPEADDPLAEAARRLLAGEVLAIKGLGGFHLAVDATNAEAISLLRSRKRRPGKPLAVMGTLEMAERVSQVSDAAAALLRDSAAPIVLLPLREGALPEGIAPGQDQVGWMLPYTPLHHLLIADVGRPLVMTSGNLSGEPQVIGNDEAREKLSAFADAFLMHDREIARRLDDSVERADPPMVLRRARGRVPGTLPLPNGFENAPQVVAYGGQMKGAMCLIKNGQALLGHHLGELDEALTWDAFLAADRDYAALFDHHPSVVAVDLHPDFRPSRHGSERAKADGLQLVEVQHHHAHLASCLAEAGWPLDAGPVAGIILDGLGLGPDGTVWGGELLLGDYRRFERCGWLRPAPLIGGDRAQAEPWRNALVRLDQAGLGDWADRAFAAQPLEMARMAAEKGLNAPLSSSAGRLFDAVAAILGICPEGQSYEGEAAMRLEAMATRAGGGPEWAVPDGPEIDPSEMIRALVAAMQEGVGPERLAWAFHDWLARAFAAQARDLVESGAAKAVALSGGCFQNALLLTLTRRALGDLPVMVHERTPANDGGLALGQAVIAAAKAILG